MKPTVDLMDISFNGWLTGIRKEISVFIFPGLLRGGFISGMLLSVTCTAETVRDGGGGGGVGRARIKPPTVAMTRVHVLFCC